MFKAQNNNTMGFTFQPGKVRGKLDLSQSSRRLLNYTILPQIHVFQYTSYKRYTILIENNVEFNMSVYFV